jgi:RNA-binding protein
MTEEQVETATASVDELTSTQRKHLRGVAHKLKPVVVVGKGGLSEPLCAEANRTLDDHELIKVKLQGCDRDERKTLAAELVESLRASLVGLVGNVAILYRRHPDPERRRISPDPDPGA